MVRLALALLLLGTSPAFAQETRQMRAGTPPAAANLSAFAWLEGSWTGPGIETSPATEVYSAPHAGQIAGHFVQTTPAGGVMFYELMQIVPRGGSLVYRLRHFNADLTGWEDTKSGRAVEFPLVAIEGDRFFFDGMTLHRTGPDAMTVWVRITDAGKTQELPFRYTRTRR